MVTGSGGQPANRRPAPDFLTLVQDFVNTRDVESARDRLAHPKALAAFMEARPELHAARRRVSKSDLARARNIREALRAVITAHSRGASAARGSLAVLRKAASVPIRLRVLDPTSIDVRPAGSGVDELVAALLLQWLAAVPTRAWRRLKTCRKCGWVFYDRSPAGAGAWCSMATCGNVTKVRAYRRRRSWS